MSGITSRLEDLGPLITKILHVSGTSGASIGVVHQNEVVHLAGFGVRDHSNGQYPDENTIYHIASLTKSFTAASLGILVHDKKLSWDQRVSSILPTFTHPDPTIRENATVLDFLSHRTGLATKQSLWAQDGQELLLKKSDSMDIVSYLEVVQPLGSWFNYNNWGYDVAAEVLEKLSGVSWGTFVSENILKPLKLERTFLGADILEENYAMGYMPSPDGNFTSVGRPTIAAGTVQQGANGVKTTVADLLEYYKAIVRSWKAETKEGTVDDSTSPLKEVKELLTGHISIDPDSDFEQQYGAGWVIVELPAPVGSTGTNGMFVSEMPVLARGSSKKKLWYHNGSLVGFFSSVHILPDTDTIIVVLTNSIPKNDAADWVGQLLVETVLDSPEKNDYVALAEESATAYEAMWQQLSDDLEKSRSNETNGRNLAEYVGRYYNKPKDWFIDVTLEDENLSFSFQGLTSQHHQLQHYGIDKFSWPLSEEESRHLGRWPDLDATTYVFSFDSDDQNEVTALRWVHDPDVPEGEAFIKEGKHSMRGGIQQVIPGLLTKYIRNCKEQATKLFRRSER